MNKETNYKLPIFAGIGVVLLIIIFSIVKVLTSDDSKGKGPASSPAPSSGVAQTTITPEPSEETFDAIITEVNTDDSVIVLCRLGSKDFEEYTYSGATAMTTNYGRAITASVLKPGDFVTVSRTAQNRIITLTGMKNVDVYKGVKNLVNERDIRRISIGDAIYRYDDSLLVLNDGYFVSLDTLFKTDVLSVYSIDGFIYMLKVTTGHGYLRLANDSAFTGGTLFIGTAHTVQITEDMLLTLQEGTYPITAENGSLKGTGTLLVSRDKTAVFDLAPFSPEPVEYCNVTFTVDPGFANLYVDGILTPYTNPVPISYGEHYIEAVLSGYVTYEGLLYTSKPSASVAISLSAAPVPADEDILYDPDSPTAVPEPEEDDPFADIPDNTTDDSPTPTPVSGTSDDLSLIIHCTEGTAVYINDVYKGTISGGSLILDKPLGTISLRLTLEGYITRNYTVSLDDDGEDAEFTFPAMVKE